MRGEFSGPTSRGEMEIRRGRKRRTAGIDWSLEQADIGSSSKTSIAFLFRGRAVSRFGEEQAMVALSFLQQKEVVLRYSLTQAVQGMLQRSLLFQDVAPFLRPLPRTDDARIVLK